MPCIITYAHEKLLARQLAVEYGQSLTLVASRRENGIPRGLTFDPRSYLANQVTASGRTSVPRARATRSFPCQSE